MTRWRPRTRTGSSCSPTAASPARSRTPPPTRSSTASGRWGPDAAHHAYRTPGTSCAGLTATALAVVFGVGFVAGSLIFGDTARAGYVDAFAGIAANVDVVVRPGDAPLTGAQLAAVRGLPGVATAEGRREAPLAVLDRQGRPVNNFGDIGVAVSIDGDPTLRPYEVVGREPGPGEALLDTDTAERLGYATGDTITVVDAARARQRLTLVGLLDFGVSRQYSGLSVVGLPSSAVAALTGRDEFREIAVHTRDRVDPAAVAAAVGPGHEVLTGERWRDDLIEDAAGWLTPFRVFLLLFGFVSLFVAAFVIYNTFAVLGALRVRQTALLRCVGATRRQVFGATVLESAVIGLVGGALGTLLGVGVSYALVALVNAAVDAGIPVRAPVLGVAPIAAGLVLGGLVTVAAALVPAVRATRTRPVAALRDQPTTAPGIRRFAVRAGAAVVVGGLGIAVTAVGYGHSDQQVGLTLIVIGGGLAFLGLLIAAPLFVSPLCTFLGAVPARLFGTPGRLARANTRRNPGRTAVTSATLMVGIGLMSLFTVVMSSVDVNTTRILDRQYPVDFVAVGVHPADDEGDAFAPVPAGYADALRGRSEFDRVGQLRTATATVDGSSVRIGAIDPAALDGLVSPDISAGTLADLTAGTAVVGARPARLGEVPLGGAVTVAGHRSTATVRIVAVSPALAPAVGNLDLLLPWADFAAIAGRRRRHGRLRHDGARGVAERGHGRAGWAGRPLPAGVGGWRRPAPQRPGVHHRQPARGRRRAARDHDRDLAVRGGQHPVAVGGRTHPRVGDGPRPRPHPRPAAGHPVAGVAADRGGRDGGRAGLRAGLRRRAGAQGAQQPGADRRRAVGLVRRHRRAGDRHRGAGRSAAGPARRARGDRRRDGRDLTGRSRRGRPSRPAVAAGPSRPGRHGAAGPDVMFRGGPGPSRRRSPPPGPGRAGRAWPGSGPTWVLTVASADDEPLGDLGVGQALGHEQQHLPFAVGERRQPRLVVGPGGELPGEPVEQPPGDPRRDHGVAAGDRPDRGQQLLGRRVLEQEAAGPGLQRGERVLGLGVEGGQHEHPGRPLRVAQIARVASTPSMHRHPDVHHARRRPACRRAAAQPQRLGAVAGLADHLHVRLGGQDHPEPGPHQRLVVDDHHPDASCRGHRRAGAGVGPDQPPPGRRAGVQRAAVARHPLPHADQPVPAGPTPGSRPRRRRRPRPTVDAASGGVAQPNARRRPAPACLSTLVSASWTIR